jgi:hypothetical protein
VCHVHSFKNEMSICYCRHSHLQCGAYAFLEALLQGSPDVDFCGSPGPLQAYIEIGRDSAFLYFSINYSLIILSSELLKASLNKQRIIIQLDNAQWPSKVSLYTPECVDCCWMD